MPARDRGNTIEAVRAGDGSKDTRTPRSPKDLFVTVATVTAHVSRLLTNLGVHNRVQVALLVHGAALDSDATK